MPDLPADLLALADLGQDHLLAHWQRLDADEQTAFARQVAAVDRQTLQGFQARLQAHQAGGPAEVPTDFTAPDVIEPAAGQSADTDVRFSNARAVGEELLAAGRVALFVVAGGQGSRLGYDGPKGCFSIGPVTDRTLFGFQARQLLAIQDRVGTAPPWLIMTSDANDAATRAYFAAEGFFGLPPENVRFFKQAMVPSLDAHGRLLLQDPTHFCLNPDGHGGSLSALHASGSLAWLADRGIDTISYIQIDNLHARCLDPVFLGFHAQAGSEFSSKVVMKEDPAEKVGVFVRRGDGRHQVIEYSDLPRDLQQARTADGQLRFRLGSPAIHILDCGFVERITAPGSSLALPYHIAHKKIPHFDSLAGQTMQPSEPNGYKFEKFVFDALPLSRAPIFLAIDREAEFLPVKNADGEFSPDDIRRRHSRYWVSALRQEGVAVPMDETGAPLVPLEVDPRAFWDTSSLTTWLQAHPASADVDWSVPTTLTPEGYQSKNE